MKVDVQYCGAKYSQCVEAFGKAPLIHDKVTKLKGGLETTDKDFVPTLHYVKQDDMTLGNLKGKNFKSLTRIMKASLFGSSDATKALDSLMLDVPTLTPYSLSPTAMQEHIKNRQKYDYYLKASRIAREKKENKSDQTEPVDIFFEQDVDIGLNPGSGLK